MAMGWLDVDRLVRETFVARVECHRELGSTNDRARECAAEGKGKLPVLVVARRQTAGRGRGEKRWWSGEGSLACSVVVDLEALGVEPGRRPMVSLAAALAVVQTVEPLLTAETVGIHWPNDVFAAGRKLAGILVEGLAGGRFVVGIGLNVNNTVEEAPTELRSVATTLHDLTGRRHEPSDILVGLLRHLETMLRQLASDPDDVGTLADGRCLQRGRELAVESGNRVVRGLCAGIAPDGALLLDAPEGRLRLHSGTVCRQ